jgi:hypothetical protein
LGYTVIKIQLGRFGQKKWGKKTDYEVMKWTAMN